ncbi:unnamed protein product [Cuscuta epithymum]|uniref:Uncharacterized protein n=1 Tax=Cuscuta epithymum TaxID=186058 RepID=A0AAV0F2G0_9ASTE|nr:unnamed protein product [Cuscuta epithymum]
MTANQYGVLLFSSDDKKLLFSSDDSKASHFEDSIMTAKQKLSFLLVRRHDHHHYLCDTTAPTYGGIREVGCMRPYSSTKAHKDCFERTIMKIASKIV